ncbi:hypothetical protein K6V33_05245 [Streptococcus suis]|uniref:hypothetical protein n=1 Tax=Streptococcus suis TaxID=1307 RepID=UPI000C1A1B86|nr:hypothetical protein [Streptococcus suis]MBY5005636.1 hypothetical protein [Streptococcus suis]
MIFEDKFSKKQEDMILLALEYFSKVKVKTDYIYIYASYETMYSFDVFCKVSTGKIEKLHELSVVNFSEEQLDNLIFSVLKIGNQDLQEIHKICIEYNRPMPTQIKLIYDNVNNKVHADYSYDLFYSNSDTLTSFDIFNQWYEEVKAEIENK